MADEPAEAPVIAFRDVAEFEDWLTDHVDQRVGVWLKLAKAGTGIPSLTSDEAVDVGLCFGWISGRRKGLDDKYYLQSYVPRRPPQPLVPGQRRQGRRVDRGGPHAPHWAGRGGSRKGGRPLGGCLRIAA